LEIGSRPFALDRRGGRGWSTSRQLEISVLVLVLNLELRSIRRVITQPLGCTYLMSVDILTCARRWVEIHTYTGGRLVQLLSKEGFIVISPKYQRARPRRLLTATTLAVLAASVVIAVTPGAANATVPSPQCPTFIATRKTWLGIEIITSYTLISATPRFFPSERRSVTNNLDTPISTKFTTSQSTTFTQTVTIGVNVKVKEFLELTVSSAVTLTRTTASGIEAAVTIPPHSTVTAEYGVDGFDTSYQPWTA
jgi:hypothetical protein